MTTGRRNRTAALLAALNIKPMSVAKLAELSGLDEKSVNAWINALRGDHAGQGLVTIGAYEEDALGRRVVPAYCWNPGGRDVPKPPALTRSQITARHRAKKARTQ